MEESPNSPTVSTKLERIAFLARQIRGVALTNLAHHIDLAWLREAHRRTRKDGATGIDRQTAEMYESALEGNLQSLLDRAKSGTYRAPPVLRVNIPKGDGAQTRPIGIPTFEDKILQRAIAMVLEAVYEQEFLNCSYGFRPRRSAHGALEAVRDAVMGGVGSGGGWILEVDIEKFFDNLDHAKLRDLLRQRVRDGVLLCLIGKWLNAGVMEAGELAYPEAGTPQGGVISPLLANVYLHEVLDIWFEREVKPRLKGRALLIRYADDFVIVFGNEDDARRVQEVLPKRFGRYGLKLHPEKTKLTAFRRPDRRSPPKVEPPASAPRETFDLLGFTHYWARSRKGHWVVKRRTAKERFSRAVERVRIWCRKNRHMRIREQWKALNQKLGGHYGYYGITGNSDALGRFREEVAQVWRKWLSRRSGAGRVDWVAMREKLTRFPLLPARLAPAYRSRSEPMF